MKRTQLLSRLQFAGRYLNHHLICSFLFYSLSSRRWERWGHFKKKHKIVKLLTICCHLNQECEQLKDWNNCKSVIWWKESEVCHWFHLPLIHYLSVFCFFFLPDFDSAFHYGECWARRGSPFNSRPLCSGNIWEVEMSEHCGLVFPEVMENFHLLAQVFAAEPKEALDILFADFNIKTATVYTEQENLSCLHFFVFCPNWWSSILRSVYVWS